MTATPTQTDRPTAELEDETADDGTLVQDDLLVEDVSIDGMCGVY